MRRFKADTLAHMSRIKAEGIFLIVMVALAVLWVVIDPQRKEQSTLQKAQSPILTFDKDTNCWDNILAIDKINDSTYSIITKKGKFLHNIKHQ